MEKPRKGTSAGRIPTYDPSFKIAVAREYFSGKYSQTQVANKHNISEGTMHYFVQWYKAHFPESPMSDLVNETASAIDSCSVNTDLEKELAYAKLKITALEMLISNAEREMGVDIRKKPGSKPSTK